ncbi:MAG: Trk family potassium uptake protein [Clostridia bacterium]|nr:Trk family potassium uptake protein [Clostridia bacterium]
MEECILKVKKRKLSYTQLIVLSFLGVILVGALILCLPISSAEHEWTDPLSALFTATSATCVTGLIVVDTYTHWSIFGQIIILLLIQIGGLGFMTIMTLFAIVTHRRITLHQRKLLMQSAGNYQLNGVMTLIQKILIGTVIFEGVGALLLAVRFIPMMGFGEGLYNAIFHAVSAFCNAGFDLMGKYGQFSSLTTFRDDAYVQMIIMALIIIGGLGFFVWSDLLKCRHHFKKYALHTKIVLVTSGFLILVGAAGFFLLERNASMADLPLWEKILASFFQSVTTRTAGFNTVDQAMLSDGGGMLSIILMLIGGSPGSTAGGMKTTTILIVMLNVIASIRNRDGIEIFKKRIDDETVKQAAAITGIYMLLTLIVSTIIVAFEPVDLEHVLFEVSSAIGTVGISMGLTQSLSALSHVLLMILMFVGRVGGLTFALAFSTESVTADIQRPRERVLVG